MGRFRCGSQTFEIKKPELAKLYEKHLNRTLADVAIEYPIQEDGRYDPQIVFDALARTWVEMMEWFAENELYYASGRCGGCEACGNPPHPDITPKDWREIRGLMKMALEEIEKEEAEV